ncbi:MAG: hypothetical protein ACTTKL_07715 [Treponema sp.]
MKKLLRDFVCGCAVLLLSALFFSCSLNMNAERKSLNSALDQIDALINQNQFADAKKELGKIEKRSYDAWTSLGIYKRYRLIGEDARAEKALRTAVRKNSGNAELLAVYSNFLMRKGRAADALKYGKSLRGEKYGSVYSEAVLKIAADKKASDKPENDISFLEDEYFPIFYDAWTGSKDAAWLRNGALLRLVNGAYSEAADIHPGESYAADDAYFWSAVMYDAARYAEAAYYASVSANLYNSALPKFKRNVTLPEVYSLASDSYSLMQNADEAEAFRERILASVADADGSWSLTEAQKEADFLRVAFTNSARWAENNGDDAKCARLLSFAVDTWEDYVPALASYADFALRTSTPRTEDYEQLRLRDEGLATLEMEKYDSRVRIPVSDAVYRIDESLARTNDPLLFIVRLNLKYKTDKCLSEDEKRADLWQSLEKTLLAPAVYPELMLDFAESFLIQHKEFDAAFDLFYKYAIAKYGFKPASFWEDAAANVRKLSLKEAEYLSYFAANHLRADDSLAFYEYCVFENGGNKDTRAVSPLVSDASCMNLALVYNSLGRRSEALDLYSKCAGRAGDFKTKSFVMYRMAELYNSVNDVKNARLSAEYALTLNPRNAPARLLLNKIKFSK